MTTPTTPAIKFDFRIDQTAQVYLEWDAQARRWQIHPATVDGDALDSPGPATSDLDEECWTEENRADLETATNAALPTADELALMLLAALGPESKVKAALAEVLDAAGYWADELVTYIAKASDEFRDHESAENQRANANNINTAIQLLSTR
jgi:hypothetical protein